MKIDIKRDKVDEVQRYLGNMASEILALKGQASTLVSGMVDSNPNEDLIAYQEQFENVKVRLDTLANSLFVWSDLFMQISFIYLYAQMECQSEAMRAMPIG